MLHQLFQHTRIRFLIRYGLVGSLGACIQLVADYICVEFFHAHYQYGVVIGFLMAVITTFTLQKLWTFKDTTTHQTRFQFTVYTLIAIFSLIGNVLLMRFFVDLLGLWYLLAHSYTIFIVTGVSFILNNFITFHERNFFKRENF
jgi:putative flippase GtrA